MAHTELCSGGVPSLHHWTNRVWGSPCDRSIIKSTSTEDPLLGDPEESQSIQPYDNCT